MYLSVNSKHATNSAGSAHFTHNSLIELSTMVISSQLQVVSVPEGGNHV